MSQAPVARASTLADGFVDEALALPIRATLLFTDVVDSTALASELGDARMAVLWAGHDRAARALMQRYRAREIDKTDGFLLLFERPADAVQFAIAYHAALATLRPPMRARVGLHVGEVSQRENAADDVARGAKPLEVDGLAKPIAARVMEIAQGGQTLLSGDAVLALGDDFFSSKTGIVAAGRPELVSHGPWMLKGVLRPVEIFEVGIRGAAPFVPPPDAAKGWRVRGEDGAWVPVRAVGHRLPAEVDAFVGREADLRALAARLDAGARLVSVLGIGGAGKTRLVTRYGWIWLGAWPGGVYFADLSDARDLAGVVSAVSDALDVPLGKEDPVQQLGHAIMGHGRCLVILDNFEQVGRHAEETLGRWLERADEASFLVTTREVLGVPGEQSLVLPPMAPADAVVLFVRRAGASKAGVWSDDDREAITELVRVLDYLPLAIELAAARVRMMPPRTLLSRMDDRFRLLTSSGGRQDRQATLRATLDWSWDLLPPAEQATLAQLSVFERGFSLETAEAVVDGGAGFVLDLIQALVDKSLVRLGGADRFELLVSVQMYASERLERSGDRAATELRHGRYFATLGEAGGAEKSGVELYNLLAACRRAVGAMNAEVAVGALEGAWGALNLRGPYAVGVELARAVGGIPGLTLAQRAKADRVEGVAWLRSGRTGEARGPLQAALAASRDAGDRWSEGIVLGYLSILPHDQGLLAEARPLYEAALAVHREVANRRSEGVVLGNYAQLLFEQGHADDALACFQQALVAHREVGGEVRAEGVVLGNLGSLYVELGQTEQARKCYETALVSHRAVGDRRSEGVALANLGLLCHDAGRLDDARAYAHAALVVHREVGDRRAVGLALANLGNLYRLAGRASAARTALEGALRIHREIGFRYGLPFACCGLAQLEAALGNEAAATSLIDEAVRVSRPYPAVHIEALVARARIRLGFGWVADADGDVAAALALSPQGRARAVVEATRALVCASDGAPAEAREALDWLDDHPQFSSANSEVGRIAAEARARVRA